MSLEPSMFLSKYSVINSNNETLPDGRCGNDGKQHESTDANGMTCFKDKEVLQEEGIQIHELLKIQNLSKKKKKSSQLYNWRDWVMSPII